MVKTSATTMAAAAATFWVLSGVISAPIAAADSSGVVTTLGQPAEIVNGAVVQAWTLTDLKPSTDLIPHSVQGTLWEAAAADTALQGEVTPIIPNLQARAADGATYPALWMVATPQGVNPSSLAPGDTAAGKVYFDVTGMNPDSVLYLDGQELALWLQPPPQSVAAGGTAAASPSAIGSSGAAEAPAAAGSQGTPVSEGTPVPAEGTPVSEGTSVPAEGTPVSEGTSVPDGTPAPEGAPAATAVAEGTPAAVAPEPAAGSQGTPVVGTPVPDASHGPSAAVTAPPPAQ